MTTACLRPRALRLSWPAVWLLLVPVSLPAELLRSDACETVARRQAAGNEAVCHAFEHDELRRTLRIHVPDAITDPVPLMVVLHGGGGSGANMEWLTGGRFNRMADRDGAIVVYPDGIGNGWNDGRSDLRAEAVRRQIDDVGFLRALPAVVAERFPVDLTRVYATGISNGGLMSFRLACDAADVYAAVAPVAANLGAELASHCSPARPVSVLIINGTEDRQVPWDGGQIRVLLQRRGEVLSVPDTMSHWRRLNDCGEIQIGPIVNAVRDDGTSVRRHVAPCAGGTELALLEVIGGGHTWPGAVQFLPRLLVGRVSREIDATEEILEFVHRFSLAEPER